MGHVFSSPAVLIAYTLPNPEDDSVEGQLEQEQFPTTAPTFASRLLGAARRISPHGRRTECEREAQSVIPTAYDGLYEVIRDFDLLNVEDIEDKRQILRIQRRGRPLNPLHVQRRISKLELRAQGIITMTPKLGSLTYLQSLDLSDNHLTFLPDSIGKLIFLKRLCLAGNNLHFLPESIGDLDQLRSIDLSRNHLSTLPVSFGKLKRLRKLLMDHNYFTALPSCITELPKLTYLFVANNYGLKALPGKLSQLSRLHFVEVMGCDMLNTQELIRSHEQSNSDVGTPSLYEWCLRHVLLDCSKTSTSFPRHINIQMSEDVKVCDYCNGPYFWHSVTRCRLIQHPEETICMEYKMCCEHWSNEKNRVRNLFHEELEPVHGDEWKSKVHTMGKSSIEKQASIARRFIIVETPA